MTNWELNFLIKKVGLCLILLRYELILNFVAINSNLISKMLTWKI